MTFKSDSELLLVNILLSISKPWLRCILNFKVLYLLIDIG